jgi:ferredoxin
MKTVLYYFSGTGNTLMLARMLAEKLEDTQIINIASCKDANALPSAENIGLLFPVYAFGLPRMMKNFIADILCTNEDTYIFSLTDYASAGGTSALKLLDSLLKKKGRRLNAGFGLAMPPNYVPFGGAESKEKQNEYFSNATEEIEKIAEIIKSRPERYMYARGFIPLFFIKFCNMLFFRDLPGEAAKFYVNDNCTSCGTCVKVCPTDNIELVEGHPVWGGNCEQCMACLQWCPETAIHRKGVPESRLHYHNPNIDVQDLIKDMGK